nr:MAG TPA: hypothetical protein [Caudoviricetes sp.]
MYFSITTKKLPLPRFFLSNRSFFFSNKRKCYLIITLLLDFIYNFFNFI